MNAPQRHEGFYRGSTSRQRSWLCPSSRRKYERQDFVCLVRRHSSGSAPRSCNRWRGKHIRGGEHFYRFQLTLSIGQSPRIRADPTDPLVCGSIPGQGIYRHRHSTVLIRRSPSYQSSNPAHISWQSAFKHRLTSDLLGLWGGGRWQTQKRS